MRFFLIAGTGLLAAMAVAGAGAHAPDGPQGSAVQNSTTTDDGTQRLNQETNERLRQQIEARQRAEAAIRASQENNARIDRDNARRQAEYEAQMRDRDAAIAAEQARYNAEMERFRAEQAARSGQSATRGGRAATQSQARTERTTPGRTTAPTRTASASTLSCAQQVQRNRQRGRAVGGALGGIAGIVGGRNLGTVARLGVAVVSVPVGALIGDAIASRLNCREQEQAAQATEQAMAGGVGTTITWRSETRPNVTGTSTVTAVEAPVSTPPVSTVTGPATRENTAGTATATALDTPPAVTSAATASAETSPCLTVTDVIIVDGEETRAPKRMCRRPPTNRFVRV